MTALLEVSDLIVDFPTAADGLFHPVDSVSFTVNAGERVGIVGESGSGKSLTAQALMRLVSSPGTVSAGSILFEGADVMAFSAKALQKWRGSQIAMVFQDPMSSLNPLMRVGRQITESLQEHLGLSKVESRTRAIELLQRVGIPDAESRLSDFPAAFSGGMRQRVCIAIATACSPKLLIADEPTTALDVTVQAQVLDLLDHMANELNTGVILISHDLGVISSFCDRILVMYAGRIIETGTAEQIVGDPQHPYTKALLASILKLSEPIPRRLTSISGAPPLAGQRAPGCSFAPRCAAAIDTCRIIDPALVEAEDGRLGQEVACGVASPAAFELAEGANAA